MGFYYFFRAKYIFHSHGTFSFVVPTKSKIVCNLWHGMPIKNIAYLDKGFKYIVNHSDYVIATSKLFAYIMAAAFRTNFENVLVTGLPRNDVLYNGKKYKAKVFEAFGIDLDRN